MAQFMSKGFRYDFTNDKLSLPSRMVLDTSVLLHLVLKPLPSYAKEHEKRIYRHAKQFLNRLERGVKEQGMFVYVPQQAITESFHYLMQSTIQPHLPAKVHVLDELKVRPQLIEEWNVGEVLANFLMGIESTGFIIVQPDELYDSDNPPPSTFESGILHYIENAWLLSADAHIVTAAEWLDIKSIASVDRDFLRIIEDGFDLYTSPALPKK
jgi:hypothetical protein